MDKGVVVGVGQFLGLIMFDFWEYEGSERGCLRGGGCGMLGEDGGIVGDTGAKWIRDGE